jgi:hypothetical protein
LIVAIAVVVAVEAALAAWLPPPSLPLLVRAAPDPALIYELVPGARVEYRGFLLPVEPTTITIGDDGLRTLGGVSSPTAPTTTVLFAGDSFAMGQAVGDAQTLPARVQEHLNRRGCHAGVLNGGVSGYTLSQIAAHTLDVVGRRHVDMVVYWAVRNDLLPAMDHTDPWGLAWLNTATRHSRTLWLAAALKTLARMVWHARQDYTAAGAARFGHAVGDLAKALAARGVAFVVIEVPLIPETTFAPDERAALFEAIGASAPVVWVLPREQPEGEPVVVARDGHLNAATLDRLAATLVDGNDDWFRRVVQPSCPGGD